MILDIGITDVKESNEFLRSLWAEMAREFGKCGWQYMPYKNKQTKTITFGFMDLGVSILMVGITYKNNGSIIKLFFGYTGTKYEYRGEEEEDLKKESELGQRLEKVVRKARRGMGKFKDFITTPTIQSLFPLSSYEGQNFKTEIVADSITKIYFPISAYDENQVEGKITHKTNQLMDFLSVETNVPFWVTSIPEIENQETKIFADEAYQEPDFIDGFSVKDGYLTISEEAKDFLSYIIRNNEENEDLQIFLNACSHFHTARKYDAQIYDHQGYIDHPLDDGSGVNIEIYTKNQDLKTALDTGVSQTEIATTLYMSAIEVVTLIGFRSEKCNECKQEKYGITSRVRNIVDKYLNSPIARQLNDYYNKRSKYLHRGYTLTNNEPTNSSIPLLDVDGENGCKFPVQVSLINLREYTSYVLRAFYKEYFLKK
jgi:hypothetical protein